MTFEEHWDKLPKQVQARNDIRLLKLFYNMGALAAVEATLGEQQARLERLKVAIHVSACKPCAEVHAGADLHG